VASGADVPRPSTSMPCYAAKQQQKSGLCSAVVSYFLYLFLTISVGPIISTSIGSIFAKFSATLKIWL